MESNNDIKDFLAEEFPKNYKKIMLKKSELISFRDNFENVKNKIIDSAPRLLEKGEYETSKEYIDKLKVINSYITKINEIVELLDDENNSIKKTSQKKELKEIRKGNPHYLDDNFKYKTPYAFSIDGKTIKVGDWRALLVETCNRLIELDMYKFAELVENNNFMSSTHYYFSYTDNQYSDTLKLNLDGDTVYIDTSFSSKNITKLIKKVIRFYGIDTKDFKIYLKYN